MQLKRTIFINQHYSSEFNVYIQNRPASVSASRVIELREREGNDSIIIDKGYYKNVTRKIDVTIKHLQLIWCRSGKIESLNG